MVRPPEQGREGLAPHRRTGGICRSPESVGHGKTEKRSGVCARRNRAASVCLVVPRGVSVVRSCFEGCCGHSWSFWVWEQEVRGRPAPTRPSTPWALGLA